MDLASVPSWTSVAWLAGGSACLAVAYVACRPLWVWKLRTLPGPKSLPFLGNLGDILKHGDMTVWIAEQANKYGDVFKFWQGGSPYVVVKDPDLCRKILLSCTSRPSLELFTLLVGELHEVGHNGLLDLSPAKHGSKFWLMRKSFEAAVMSPTSLAAHGTMLADCASRLVTFLDRYASSGEPIDMVRPLADMTMDAIGWAAFGLDLRCMGGGDGGKAAPTADGKAGSVWYDEAPGSAEFSAGLVTSSRLIFKHTDFSQTSPLKLPGLMVPALYHVIRYLANIFPDALQREELQARRGLQIALQKLMTEWKRHKEAGGAAGKVPQPAISDTGFLARMLNSIGGEAGVKETDIMAQVLLMMLAGYETTSSALAVSMHLLATHPEAQSHAARELDEVLAGKAPTPADFERLPYLCSVINEALRLYPPADAAVRKMVTSDGRGYDAGDGRVIPDGLMVWLDIYVFHRDPAIWPRATEFLPERHMQPGNEGLAPSNPNAFLPFGHGTRMCPGYKFAQMEARMALARVLQAYTLKPAAGCPPPVFMSGIVYTPNAVWLTIAPHAKSA